MATGLTAVQKILAAHTDGKARVPGELVWARVDWACIDDVQWPIFKQVFPDLGGTIFDRERVIAIADHYLPPSTVDQAETVNELRAFAQQQQIPYGFFTQGVKHQVFVEEGLLQPGQLLVATDSHTPTAGAVGAIGIAVGPTEVAAAFVYGTVWLRVPQTIQIVLQGTLSPMVFAKDIALQILGQEGTRFGNYRVLEFDGEALATMGLSERMTLANMGTEMGAKATMVAPGVDICSDHDAGYERKIVVDVTHLPPLVAAPHRPSNVAEVERFAGVRIDQAFIGSCANATYDDLAVVARIVRGHRIASTVQMIVTPSSMAAYRRAAADGVIDALLGAGGGRHGAGMRRLCGGPHGRAWTWASPHLVSEPQFHWSVRPPGVVYLPGLTRDSRRICADRTYNRSPRGGVCMIAHTESLIEGRCWVFGDDIDTDVIIPARYVALRDITAMATHTMEPVAPQFGTECRPGDLVVGGESFGAGSSREVAVLVFKILGVGAIVAESFARIFFRNAINNGLYAVEAPGVRGIVRTGQTLRVDLARGAVYNSMTGGSVSIVPWQPEILALVEAGGLVPYLRRRRAEGTT